MRARFYLAVVLAVLIVLIVLVLILVVLVLVLILVILVLVSVLVIHNEFLRICTCDIAAKLACPKNYDLSLALKIRLTMRPLKTAAVIPPAAAFNPPVKIPKKPSLSMASRTPLERL